MDWQALRVEPPADDTPQAVIATAIVRIVTDELAPCVERAAARGQANPFDYAGVASHLAALWVDPVFDDAFPQRPPEPDSKALVVAAAQADYEEAGPAERRALYDTWLARHLDGAVAGLLAALTAAGTATQLAPLAGLTLPGGLSFILAETLLRLDPDVAAGVTTRYTDSDLAAQIRALSNRPGSVWD